METEKQLVFKIYPIQTKIGIFQVACISILLYGSETWILSEKIRKSLVSFATNCYRIMLSIKHTDKITNDEIYRRTQQIPLSNKVLQRQLILIGHMLRRYSEEPIRIYGLYEPKAELGKIKKDVSYNAGLIRKIQ